MMSLLQVMANHAVGCHAVVIARPGAIKKTTSGKVQRRACRAAFLAGEYSQVITLIKPLLVFVLHFFTHPAWRRVQVGGKVSREAAK